MKTKFTLDLKENETFLLLNTVNMTSANLIVAVAAGKIEEKKWFTYNELHYKLEAAVIGEPLATYNFSERAKTYEILKNGSELEIRQHLKQKAGDGEKETIN